MQQVKPCSISLWIVARALSTVGLEVHLAITGARGSAAPEPKINIRDAVAVKNDGRMRCRCRARSQQPQVRQKNPVLSPSDTNLGDSYVGQ